MKNKRNRGASTRRSPRTGLIGLWAALTILAGVPADVVGQQPEDRAEQAAPASAPAEEVDSEAEDANADADETTGEDGAPFRGEIPPPSPGSEAPQPPSDASPELAAHLEQFGSSHARYAREIQDYQDTIDAIVEAEYNRRIAEINARYDREISDKEVLERERRASAIETFEQFLLQNPNEPRYTPDAIFRLAELHFEKANDDYMLADERYQQERELYEAGRIADPPEEPERSYAETMHLFRRLIADWPDYRQIDGAYYLLAYTEQQMGNPDIARDLFAELIVKRPDSRFVPEAWLRVGEYHFDYSGAAGPDEITRNLELARNAYMQAMQDEGSAFYDKALYKLAWTYYRLDNYDQAIRHFQKLVEYSDEVEARTGRSGAVLREEAVQYMAISLAEEDWDLDGSRDADYGMARVQRYLSGEHPYEREVLAQLAEFHFDRTQFEETIAIYEYMLEKYPTHRENPLIHEKIVLALHRDQQPEAAFEVRRRLLEYYGPESDWLAYQTRIGNEEAIGYADNIVRENLILAATWYHEEAQKLRTEALVRRDADLLILTQQRYALAAEAYEEFLRRYPNDKEAFQWNFYYAECLYYSGQYERAHEQYVVVRELDLKDNEYQELSAFNAIKSVEFTMRDMIQRGQLTPQALGGLDMEDARATAQNQAEQREVDERGEQIAPIESEPIPPIVLAYVTAMDRYVVLGLKNAEDTYLDAKFAFQAAKVFYDFKHYDTARERFAWIVDNYPENEVAYLSGSLILETFREEQDYGQMAAWADRLTTVIKGEQAEAVKAEVREFRLGALFKSAEALFAEKKYAEAAEEYIRLINDAPDHEYAPKALNNAAVAYEILRRYDSALRLYERVYQDYPQDPLAGYALYRVAINSERFFEFEKAIQSYQLFYDKYRGQQPAELTAMGFNVESRRAEALKSVAVLNENLQQYEDAARTYVRFARSYPNDAQAADAMWQAAQVWRKADKHREMIDTIQAYIREYGSIAENNMRVLEGMTIIADYYEERNDRRNSARWYSDVLTEFERRGLEPASQAAYYSGKAQFMLTEHDFDKWRALKITGALRQQERLLKQKMDWQKKLVEDYTRVMSYRNLEWTMAANFRIGSLLQNFAAALYEVPIPFRDGTEEFDVYQMMLEDIAIPLEEAAIERYEQTIQRAQQDKIVNEWTKRTIEELNRFKPAEYPLYKEERRAVERRSLTGMPLLDAEGYQSLKERSETDTEMEDGT